MIKHTKCFFSFGFLFLAGIFLSGCSSPFPVPSAPVNTVKDPAFQAKPTVGSIWKSEDGGKTFVPKIEVDEKNKITTANILAISFLERDPETPNPTVAPKVYVGTVDTGIFESRNGGENWQHIVFPPQKIYSFIVDRSNSTRMFATGVVSDRGKVFRTSDAGESWQDVYTEPGLKTIVLSLYQHPRDTNVIFTGTSTGTVTKSTDKGDTWKNVGQKIDGPVTEITSDAVKPKTIYALAFKKKVWYSNTGGEEWIDWEEVKKKERDACLKNVQENKLGAEARKKCEEIADPKRAMPQNIISLVADPRMSGKLLVGADKGLYVSTDYGKYWDPINIIESAQKFPIRAVAISHRDSKEITFVAGKAFYKSINNGVTWAVVQLNVDRDVSVLQYDPFDANILYFGLRKN